MPLKIIRADITKLKVDAIVNPTDIFLSGSGSIDKKIANKGNKNKYDGMLEVSETYTVEAVNMDCKYIINAVGPCYIDGKHNEEKLLEQTYNNCLLEVKERNIQSVAFPLISTGTFNFPKDLGLNIATQVFTKFLLQEDIDIYLVVYDKTSFGISKKIFSYITEYIDDNYILEERNYSMFSRYDSSDKEECELKEEHYSMSFDLSDSNDIGDIFVEDTFTVKLFELIDKKGLKDPEVYKKANIDRKLFSKIRSNDNYNPSKKTAIALSIALELSYNQTQDLLGRAGYTLSKSNKFDLIIEACIKKGIYNIFEINNILYSFDLPLLD